MKKKQIDLCLNCPQLRITATLEDGYCRYIMKRSYYDNHIRSGIPYFGLHENGNFKSIILMRRKKKKLSTEHLFVDYRKFKFDLPEECSYTLEHLLLEKSRAY